MAQSPRRWSSSPLALAVAAAVFAACSDRVGPGASRAGEFGIAPRYQSAAAGVVDVAAIRVLLYRLSTDSLALDTVVAFPAGADSVSLVLAVRLEQPGEDFALYLRLIDPAGDTVFTSGPDVVRPASGGASPPVVEPVLDYVGVGADATSVVITSPEATLYFGDAIVLQAAAFDASQAAIPGTPIEWISLDPLIVVVPAADSGRVIAGTQRGTARIVARTPTDLADTVRIVTQPVPAAIAAEAGGAQTAPGGSVLPLPLVARVTAADGLGVRGVWVRFAVTAGGGALGADSVLTDSTGRASVSFQIGQTGPQTVQATTAALGGQIATFTATVQAGPPDAITIVAGDGQSAIAGSSLAVAPRVSVTDSVGQPVAGVMVTFTVTLGGGSVTGGTPLTEANGEAAVTAWTLGIVAGANALQASVGALSVTFSATGIPGPASLLPLVGGDAQSDTAGATLTQPLVVRATDANGNGTAGVPIAWTATGGTLSDDTVVTDAAGLAQVGWTLPTTAGTPGATARIAGTAVTRAFTATVLPASARQVAFLVQPSNVAQGGAITPPVDVEVTDQFGNRRTADAGRAVAIAIGANPGGATLGGTTTGNTVGGVASFANLTLGAPGDGYTFVASSAGLVPDTSAAFNVLAPPGQAFWTNAAGGNWSAGANWSTGVAPGPTDTAFITLDGTYTVTLDANATIAGLVLGAASGTQTLTGTARTVTVGGSAAIQSNGVVSLSGGSIAGTGPLTNQGQVTLLDVPVGVAVTNDGILRLRGTTALNGAVSNLAGAELRVEGFSVNGAVTTAAGWTNAGTLVLSHGGAGGGQSATLTVAGTLVNATGAVLRAEAGIGGGARTLAATLDNRGLVDVQTVLTLSRASAAHVNSGTIAVTGGDLTVPQTGTTPSLTSTGTMTVGAGRTLAITGGAWTTGGSTLNGAGTVTLTSVAWTIGAGYTIDSLAVSATGGSIGGTGPLVNRGAATTLLDVPVSVAVTNDSILRLRGTTALNGAVTNVAGAELRVEASSVNAAVTTAGGWTNAGTVLLSHGGGGGGQSATLSVGGTLVNATGAVLRAEAGVGGGARTLAATLDNQGLVDVQTPVTLSRASAAHVNSGTIAVAGGDLTVSQTGTTPSLTSTGTITVGAGRTLTLTGGAWNTGGSTLNGAGTVTLTAVAWTIGAGYTIDSLAVSATGGSIGGTGLLTNQGQVTLLDVPVGMAVTNDGILRLRGTTALNGAVSNLAGAELRVEGFSVNGAVTTAAGWTNAGTLVLSHGGAGGGQSATLTVGGTLVNATGAVLRAEAGIGGGARTLAATLDNQGLVDVQTPVTLSRASAAHVNSGTIAVTGGDLTVSQTGTSPSLTSTGTMTVGAGRTLAVTGGTFTNTGPGLLQGAGTLDVATTTFSNAGTVGPGLSPGILTVTGNYPQAGTGTLAVEVGGVTVGTQYDRLAVSGAAALAGTLNVTLTGGFTPAGGEQFTVLTFASRSGDFTTVNLPALPGGLGWQRTFTGTAMVLTVSSAFTGAPPGTDAVWTGAASSSWTDAANWTPGIPGPTDDVFIRADAANPPTVTGVRTIDSLAVQAGAIVTVSGAADTLVVAGSLAAGSPAIAGSGAVRLTGSGQTARGRVPGLVVTGTIAASDSLRVTGDLVIGGTGRLNVSAFRVAVDGSLTTTASGTLGMTGLDDRVDVAGGATFGGGDSFLTGGVLTVAGHFTQSGMGPRFRTTDAHRTRLTGGAGQTVTFADPLANGFGQLTILTADSLHVASLLSADDIVVADSLAPGAVVVRGTGYLVAKNPSAGQLVVRSDAGRPVRVRAAGLRLFGNVAFVGTDVAVQVSELEYWGDAPVTIPADPRLTFTRLTVRGTRVGTFASGQTYGFQDLIVTDDASLGVGGATVNLSGDLSTDVGGVLRMAAGDVLNAATASFGGGSTAGLLTGGTLRISGDFDQAGDPESFAPSGTHVTALSGSGGTLTFADPAQNGGSHFHHLDVRMSGTASNGGELVINGNLFIQDTAQFAPSGITGGSGNRITVVGSATIAQSSTAAVLTSDVLRFGGAVSRTGGAVVDGDTVEFFGTNQTVPTNLSPAFALKVTGDSVLFAGSTTWRGMLVTGNGLADIGGATVAVDSTFRTTGGGRLRMTNPAGKLSVRREARFEGGSTAGRMTAGTLDLGSHFTQTGLTSPSSFAPSGTHLTHFRNFDLVPGNPNVVPVTISISNTFASTFRNLLIDEEISATMQFRTVVTGSLTKPEFATLTGTTVEVGGDLTAGGALNGIIDFDTVMVAGVLTPNLSSQDYRISVLVMTGAAQILPSFPHYATVAVRGDSVVLAGGADMLSLFVEGTGLADVGGNIQVYGSLETRGQGRLRMAGGSLFVGGNATFGGGSTAGLLTGGTLSFAGTFTQTGANSTSAFSASGAHVTQLIGSSPQAITFGDPDFSASRFGHLMVAGSGGAHFLTDAVAAGQLRSPAPAGGLVRTLSGSGAQSLLVLGLDADSLLFDGARLAVTDGAPIARFADVAFVNQDPDVDQFTLMRTAGDHTFPRIAFQTTPGPGSVYVSLVDTDGTPATPFSVTMDQPSPADPGAFTRTDGIATLTWGTGGVLAGTVRNAVGGVELFGATVDLKAGANAPQSDPTLLSTVTDEAGAYSFSGLTAGDYTLWVSASGFIDGAVTGIAVTTSGPTTVDVALSPLQQAGETRIVLSWGAQPLDLDAWLVVPDTIGGPPSYVSYGAPGASATYPFSQLDNDVTNGYGPETITIYQQLTGTYQFRVHDYAAGDNATSTTLQASEARVDVYQNNELVQTFTVPDQPGSLWTVFELNGATLTPINAMSGESPQGPIAGALSQLAFAVEPSNTTVGLPITPAVQVAALDAFGTLVPGFTGIVTVSLYNGTGLSGTTSVAAVNGIATFGDLSIAEPASGYILEATIGTPGVNPVYSVPFDVTVAAQISGFVRQALGIGVPIAGASVQLKLGASATTGDPVYQSTLTDAGGGYFFPVPDGQYTLFFGGTGLIPNRVPGVTVTAGQTTTVNTGLTPPLPGGQTRIVLSWTDTTPELDSHLLGPDGQGGEFHVYYVTPGDSASAPFALLHQDVGDGQGPEAVTIYTQLTGVYEFRVHDWARGDEPADSLLRASAARVDVYQGTQQVQSFSVPNQLGTLWKVFQLSGATLTPVNQIVGDPPGTPIGGGGVVSLGLGEAASLSTSAAPRLGPPRTPR